MRSICIIFFCGLFTLFSCNNSQAPANTGAPAIAGKPAANTTPIQSKLNDGGTQLLMVVVSKYYGLKNALVATKAARADSAATQLAMAADSLQQLIQKDSTNITALKPYIDTIINQSKQIAGITDESCERQRLAFGTLSSAMYGLLKNVQLKNAGIYREYCPMAFNEKGAYWLSDETEIKNPYFGKKMIECGEVTDSL